MLVACAGTPSTDGIVDCPLRDQPYSVDTPMMDLMANDSVKALLEDETPKLMQMLPAIFRETQAPSLSAIMSLRGATQLLRMPMGEDALNELDNKLAAIPLTREAKRALCVRYDNDAPSLALTGADRQILVFDKFNGYGHGEGTVAAGEAIKAIGAELGWGVSVTDKGGAFTPEALRKFDVVVWNNVSGDVLTLRQRQAFENYINQGGGFLGIHGSGGDFIYLWDWYLNELLGAQFIGHTMNPHYQDATLVTEPAANGIGDGMDSSWTLHDEWYSFAQNPRDNGASVVVSVDESSYQPEMSGISLRMGDDHPIAWTRCVGNGRSFYTATGHLPEVYQSKQNLALLKNALIWSAGDGKTDCSKKQ